MTKVSAWSVGLLNSLAAVWAFALAFVILFDVVGRMFGFALQGTVEIIANSIVAIVFLQFPLAIERGTFLRATLIYDRAPEWGRIGIDVMSNLFGAAVFLAMAIGSYDDMITGFRIHEFEGEGALRVPVYPVRAIIFAMSLVAVACYAHLIFRRLTRRPAVAVGSFDAEI
jgi:TRAP-type C4-dicarboxylate transport system permease small subunit